MLMWKGAGDANGTREREERIQTHKMSSNTTPNPTQQVPRWKVVGKPQRFINNRPILWNLKMTVFPACMGALFVWGVYTATKKYVDDENRLRDQIASLQKRINERKEKEAMQAIQRNDKQD